MAVPSSSLFEDTLIKRSVLSDASKTYTTKSYTRPLIEASAEEGVVDSILMRMRVFPSSAFSGIAMVCTKLLVEAATWAGRDSFSNTPSRFQSV